MFTVKHITDNGESIHAAVSVTLDLSPAPGARQTVYAHMKDTAGSFDRGTVYVMNESGATVAKYTLG